MQPPHMLFILVDDLGWRDLGVYGSTFYETPNLDRLAREGMLFTRAYASAPVCSPTRASILSGKYPARIGLTQYLGGGPVEGRLLDVPYLHYLPLEERSLAAVLRDHAGYQTWHVGKWHLGDEAFYPENHGFDVNLGGCHKGHPTSGYFSPWDLPTLENGPEGKYLTDHLTDEAIGLIRGRGERPFFLHLSHYAVHTPIQAPEDLVEKYRAKVRSMRLDGLNPFVEGDCFPCLHKADQRIRRRVLQSDPVYAAMVENLDANVGRVLDVLDEEGIRDETIVVFVSDNGGLSSAEGSPTCNHPLSEGKGWNYEGGTRVCQLLRWPGIVAPDSRCHENVQSCDFYPTLLEAAGLPSMPDQHCDGVSLMPLLRGVGSLDREAIFWHYPHYGNQGNSPAASVLEGDWKLIQHFEDGLFELFNLAEDSGEHRNLAARQPAQRDRLAGRLQAWQREVEAAIPDPNPEWEAKRPRVANNATD